MKFGRPADMKQRLLDWADNFETSKKMLEECLKVDPPTAFKDFNEIARYVNRHVV